MNQAHEFTASTYLPNTCRYFLIALRSGVGSFCGQPRDAAIHRVNFEHAIKEDYVSDTPADTCQAEFCVFDMPHPHLVSDHKIPARFAQPADDAQWHSVKCNRWQPYDHNHSRYHPDRDCSCGQADKPKANDDTQPVVPERQPNAAEVLGLLTVHLLQEHWEEAREIANEIRIHFTTNPAKPIAIDFTHDFSQSELLDAIEGLLITFVYENPLSPDIRDAHIGVAEELLIHHGRAAFVQSRVDRVAAHEKQVAELKEALRGLSAQRVGRDSPPCWCPLNHLTELTTVEETGEHHPTCAAARTALGGK